MAIQFITGLMAIILIQLFAVGTIELLKAPSQDATNIDR